MKHPFYAFFGIFSNSVAYSLKFIIHFKNFFFNKVRTGYIPEAESVVLKGTVKEK